MENKTNQLRPLQHLIAAGKLYPGAWKLVEDFRESRGKDLPAWPRWCFLPMAGWYAIVCDGNKVDRITDPRIALDIGRLSAIGTWRYTQGIYRFDPDFYAEIADTVLNGEIPVEVLLRLPEWSLYIETPGRTWNDSKLFGFWVHLEWDANTERKELRLLLDTETALTPFPIHLGPWPLLEAVTRAINEASLQAKLHGLGPLLRPAKGDKQIADQLHPLLAMVLYLCSDEPEITGPMGISPARPEPKKTKKGWRLFPPDKPTVWRIGEQVGSLLRRAVNTCGRNQEGKSPRAHIRRAHWHGYWTGSGDKQKFQYRWLSPIIVRGRDPETGET